MIKFFIYCPFCLENTKKWKNIFVVYKTCNVHFIDTDGICKQKSSTTLEAKDEKSAKEFETKVLKKHMDVCGNKNNISNIALQAYKL